MDRFKSTERRQLLRKRAVDFLGGKCQICSYDKCLDAFDFHHEDPLTKDFVLSSRMTSWRAIEGELKKVILVCCRCHREIHAGFHPSYLMDNDKDRGLY